MKSIMIVLLATASLLGAVEIPEALLVNQAEMTEHKLLQMYKLVAWVDSSAMVADKEKSTDVHFEHYFTDEEKNSKSLAAILKGHKWNFALHNPLAVVRLSASVQDRQGKELFVSHNSFRLTPVKDEGGNVSYTNSELHIQFYLLESKLYVGDAFRVKVNPRDSDGWEKHGLGRNPNYYPKDKVVEIPMLSAMKHGEIILYFEDNGVISSEAYDLGTGEKLEQVAVSLWVESSILNVWVVDPTALSFTLSQWIDPTALLLEVHAEEKGLYLIDPMTESGFIPDEIVFTFPNKEKVTVSYKGGENNYIPLKKGVNYVRFNWPQEAIDAYANMHRDGKG